MSWDLKWEKEPALESSGGKEHPAEYIQQEDFPEQGISRVYSRKCQDGGQQAAEYWRGAGGNVGVPG